MNLNLNALPEGSDDAAVFAPTPLIGEQSDPMAIWGSKELHQEPEQVEAEAPVAQWEEVKADELDDLMTEFMDAIMTIMQAMGVSTNEWQQIPIDNESALFFRVRPKQSIEEIEAQYTQEELDMICPNCDRTFREHLRDEA